jgi:hypothetical protein
MAPPLPEHALLSRPGRSTIDVFADAGRNIGAILIFVFEELRQ